MIGSQPLSYPTGWKKHGHWCMKTDSHVNVQKRFSWEITQSLTPRILSTPYSSPTYTPATVPVSEMKIWTSTDCQSVKQTRIVSCLLSEWSPVTYVTENSSDTHPSMLLPCTFSLTEKHRKLICIRNVTNCSHSVCIMYNKRILRMIVRYGIHGRMILTMSQC